MKAEYDFSGAERAKFYHPGVTLSFPVYLEADVNEFLTKVAEQKNVDIQELVNDLLRANMRLIESVR